MIDDMEVPRVVRLERAQQPTRGQLVAEQLSELRALYEHVARYGITPVRDDRYSALTTTSALVMGHGGQPASNASSVIETWSAAVGLIGESVPQYQMNRAERDAMDRAFWRSVTVLSDGFEA
jgi:hypothetical protein